MTDFFIKFMATDQLGRIATLHMVKADQSDLGTFDEDSVSYLHHRQRILTKSQQIKLAELHSTAVDFSKTGIAASNKYPSSGMQHSFLF